MIQAIKKEIEDRKSFIKNPITSIYYGGGTPSIINPDAINHILDSIYKNYKIDNSPEITLECNPEDISEKKLVAWKKSGINRLSIGVQSFDNNILKIMNRAHNSEQSIKSIKKAQDIGYENISIDLIYGFPSQSTTSWEEDLIKMINLKTPHFSAYCLTIEKKTPIKKLIDKGVIKNIDEEKILIQYEKLTEIAKENNFIQYEISNFGKKDFFSKHNISYWSNKIFLGVGPSSHSFNKNTRRWNIASNRKYIEKINNNEIYWESEKLKVNDRYNEYILTKLRTIWGLNIEEVKDGFGIKFKRHLLMQINKWVSSGDIIKNGDSITLNEKGKLFADKIASDLFFIC